MKKAVLFLFLGTFLMAMTCRKLPYPVVYSTDQLEIIQLRDGLFLHISQIALSNGSRFPCNGLIYIDQGEAVVYDTPASDEGTSELMTWMEKKQLRLKAVVPNHYHEDCIQGLPQMIEKGALVYLNIRTYAQLDTPEDDGPFRVFDSIQEIRIGHKTVVNRYFGPAHSSDNIVSYLPAEKVLFGGCQVKAMGAGRGNVADADTKRWPVQANSIKAAYPEAEIVVPGHGSWGNHSLLDFTAELFSKD